MNLITKDDLLDIYIKANQRGISYIISKLKIQASERTRSTFNEEDIESSYAKSIPRVIQR